MMRLRKEDYVLEQTTDGGYFAYLSYNIHCNACGETPEEALNNLLDNMNEYISDMYLVEEFV